MKLRIYQFAAVVVLMAWITAPALAFGADASSRSARGANIFQANCLVCHGADGTGSAVGKSMNTPNLKSNRVQKQSNAMLAHFISDGNGRMPAFKNRLDDRQIADVVRYIRSLPKK